MPRGPLAELVLDELRTLRRQPSGVTVETLGQASVICRLLGSGDPYLAYTRLQHGLIDASADRTLRAAAGSLGFSTSGDTHLKRLDEAGDDLGLDQRQVRRLSDQGLTTLAALISTNWVVEAVPELTVVVTRAPTHCVVLLRTDRPLVIEMSNPEIELLVQEQRIMPGVNWRVINDGSVERTSSVPPLWIERSSAETSLVISWRGEIWPKFAVHWHGDVSGVTSETLGNKLMLRL